MDLYYLYGYCIFFIIYFSEASVLMPRVRVARFSASVTCVTAIPLFTLLRSPVLRNLRVSKALLRKGLSC